DILGSGPNSWINARGITLVSDSGSVGNSDERVNLRIPLDSRDFSGPNIKDVEGYDGVYLDIQWGALNLQQGALTLGNISSANGSVDLNIHDAVNKTITQVTTTQTLFIDFGGIEIPYTYTTNTPVITLSPTNGVVTLGNISAADNVIINVGDDPK